MMRASAPYGRGSNYGDGGPQGLRRGNKIWGQRPGDRTSAIMKKQTWQRTQQENAQALSTPSEAMDHVLGGSDSHVGSPSAQANVAAENKRLQLVERLSSDSPNSQASDTTSSSSASLLMSGPASMSNHLAVSGSGTPLIQTEMQGGEAPTHLFSSGSAYNISPSGNVAQCFSVLAAADAMQADGDGDVDMDLDVDDDDDFMLPFSSP